MGCGQSKIHLYPRKSKSKSDSKKSGHIDEDADADEDEGHAGADNDKEINKDREKVDDESISDDQGSPEQPNGEISISLMRAKNLSLLQSQEISTSQQNFFRMLDRKIDDGPDYDSSSETEMALEEARLNALVQHWESASLTASMCSSTSRSLQGTPVRQMQLRHTPHRNPLQQTMNTELMTPQQQLKHTISPKRDDRSMVVQNMNHHQMYTVQQHQQLSIMTSNNTVAVNAGEMMGASIPINSNTMGVGGIPRQRPIAMNSGVGNSVSTFMSPNTNINQMLPQHHPMSYYPQAAPLQTYYGDVQHQIQLQETLEPRFPAAISVQRLAPQVQRQLRETQELIKDSCTQLYAAGYGSPGPPIRTQQRPNRRQPLETQFSQELS